MATIWLKIWTPNAEKMNIAFIQEEQRKYCGLLHYIFFIGNIFFHKIY